MSNDYDGADGIGPRFKMRDNREEAIESNVEWDVEEMDSGAVLLYIAEFLGPTVIADIVGRHLLHTQGQRAVRAMAERLMELSKRR